MNKNRLNITYLLIALCAFIYVLIRAVSVEITYDEAWTIQAFVGNTTWDIITYRILDTNNHMVNSLLIKLLFTTGNHSLFVARLPNELALIAWLYFGYRVCTEFVGNILGICAFLLLLLNPFLLDFFGLARGYGLFLGAEMASLYYLFLFFRDKRTRYATLALTLGAIAVLCNFSVLNYWLIIAFLINVMPFLYKSSFNRTKVIWSSIAVGVALAAIIYEPLRKLKANGNLEYFGGTTGFYRDTLLSVVRCSLYTPNVYATAYIVLHILTGIFIGSTILSFFRSRFAPLSARNIMLYALATGIVSATVQHYVFHRLYLIDRIALFFYPIIVLAFCLAIKEMWTSWYTKAILIVVVTGFGYNLFRNVNFYKTALWSFNAHTTQILTMINEEGKRQNKKMTVDYSWPFITGIDYYMASPGYPYIEMVKDRGEKYDVNRAADYYIFESENLYGSDYDGTYQPINHMVRDTAMCFKEEGVYVLTHLR